jgi:hypothetical protein
VRHVLAQIDVAAVGDRADEVVALIHAAAEAVNVGLARFGGLAEEGEALVVGGLGQTGEREHRGGEVDGADRAVGSGARLIFGGGQRPPLLREMDDERDAEAGVVGPALAAGMPLPVVGVEENDGVACEPVGLQLVQDFAGEGRPWC